MSRDKTPWLCKMQSITLVIFFLGIFIVLTQIIIALLLLRGVTGKEGVTEAMMLALFASPVTTALGGLIGILVAPHLNKDETQTVKIDQPESEPVPTTVQDP